MMEQPDPEGDVCCRLGGRVRHLKINGKKMKVYDYYYVDDTNGDDENTMVLTKRDEKLLFLKLFLDRAVGHDETIRGWNYPFPFYQEFHVEKRINHWHAPGISAQKLMKNIDSPWRVYFHYSYHHAREPYDYYVGIDTAEERQLHQKYEKKVEDQLRYAMQLCTNPSVTTNVKLLSDVVGEFIVYRSGNAGVDYDSKYRALDHYVLVANNRVYMGTLEFPKAEFPKCAVLKPGRYRIVGRTVPSTGIFNELKIKISIRSAECLETIENSPLDDNYHKNLNMVTSYKSGVLDRIENEKVKATILWNQLSSNTVSFIIFWIFSMIFIIGIISAIITVLNWRS